MLKHFSFKEPSDIKYLLEISPKLLLMLADMVCWCEENYMPCVVTRVIADKIIGLSISDTHKEGRAFDLSVYGWSQSAIQDFIVHFNNKYANIAAISSSDGKPRAVVYHDGTAMHFHVQVRSNV